MFVLSCTSTGNPAPSFTWRLNGVDIPTSSYVDTPVNPSVSVTSPYTRTDGSTTSNLNISSPEYPSDDGVYECIGVNSHGGINSNTTATITVIVQGIITPVIR